MVDLRGKKTRGSCDIAVGDRVQSRYRARWCGVVLELRNGMATVRMDTDEHGVPVRKPKTFEYHCGWFVVIERPTKA